MEGGWWTRHSTTYAKGNLENGNRNASELGHASKLGHASELGHASKLGSELASELGHALEFRNT